MDYTGYKELYLNDADLAHFYEGKLDTSYLLENQYLIIKTLEGEVVDKYVRRNGELTRLKYHVFSNKYSGTIKPRNPEQELAFDLMQDKTTTVKLLTGNFGVGKSFILIAAAVDALCRNAVEKIVWVRNNIEVKDSNPIGFEPGSKLQKLISYAMPLADHVGGIEGLTYLIDNNQVEIEHLGHIRGRSIKNSIIMCSEAENLTKAHIQLLLGRVDEGSMLWMDGDFRQRDKAVFEKSAGLETMIERLKGQDLFGYVKLKKTERSRTAQLADLLD